MIETSPFEQVVMQPEQIKDNIQPIKEVENERYAQQIEQFDNSLAQVAAATMMAQSLSMCLERKHLVGIDKSEFFELTKRAEASSSLLNTKWLKITQVGRPINDNLSACFEAMQNILQSCAIPNTKLLFLITGNGKSFNLFIGIKAKDNETSITDFQSDVSNFVNISWTGVSCKVVDDNSDDYKEIKDFTDEKYSSIHAVTGIPTQNVKSGYPGTVEYLMGGLRDGKMAYLVVAEPVNEQDIDDIIYCCDEMQGQAESMKSFSFAENIQHGHNESISKSHGITHSVSKSISDSRLDSKVMKSLLIGGGVLAAGLAFPAILPLVGSGALAAPGGLALLEMLAEPVTNGGLGGVNILAAMIPHKTKTDTTGEGTSDTTSKSYGTSESYSKSITKNLVNAHISRVVEHLKKQIARYEEGKAVGMWNVGCYLFSNAGNQTSPLQLKSLLSGKDSIYEPIRIHKISNFCEYKGPHKRRGFIEAPKIETLVKTQDSQPQVYSHPFGKNFNGLTSLLTTKELTCLANFPLHSVPGINVVEATADFSLSEQTLPENKSENKENKEDVVKIGKLLWSGSSTEIDVHLPLDTLSRHALVCGVNGSGKTNTVLSILDGFAKAGRHFFVIEPAKTEYVDWAIEYNKKIDDPKQKIKIFIPGCKKYTRFGFTPDILKINPFEVIKLNDGEMRPLSHIDRLKSSFAAAFPMQDILPVIMEHLLYSLYTRTSTLLKNDIDSDQDINFPTIGHVNETFISTLMKNIGYAAENTLNISAALRTRFNSLTYGWKGDLLNNERLKILNGESGVEEYDWNDLFNSKVVVNLSYAGDDQDRAFIMSLLLQFLYEYRIAESEKVDFSFNSNSCRHLVVVEEAHRVMGNCENQESPQYKSGLMFSNFLSEVRAYGQGMMVVDQVPTRLIEDAIKNTNVKIIHKLVAADDAETIAQCIGLTQDQQKVISKLTIGKAVLAGFNSANVASTNGSDIYLAKINKMK